jgi:hypothetical protein
MHLPVYNFFTDYFGRIIRGAEKIGDKKSLPHLIYISPRLYLDKQIAKSLDGCEDEE